MSNPQPPTVLTVSVPEAVDGNSNAELRTFLFADVRGYTRFTQERGNEAAARLVTKFAALTREGVQARGGYVLELRGDEVLAVFGSARQALRAAVNLQALYARQTAADPSMPLPVGIGLDAGEAVPVEEGYRGEALNLAARLCNLAGPGEVLATEGVVYLGRRLKGISYAERGIVPIKGFAEGVKVIRVVGTDPDSHQTVEVENSTAISGAPSVPDETAIPIGGFLGALPSGVLVGREQEWDRIMASLERVMQGTGQLVLLSGEPGIGKTRLAQEVTLKARHWGFMVATGRCYEPEQAVAYYPFLEALVALYEASGPTIQGDVPRRWPQLGRLIPDQVGIIPVPTEAQEDQHLLFRAVTGFIAAVAETTPVALLLDDLHWADDSSLKLLQYLARYTRGNRVFLLGAYRDVEVHRQHPLETALLDLGREQLVEEVEVHRLDQEGTTALTAEIMGAKEDMTDLAQLVYRRTDGNAFFIQEMLRALIERGDLYQENGHWASRTVREMEVPKSIRSVIGQRLSHLEARAQEILREASVLGQQFAFDDLLALGREAPHPRVLHPFSVLAAHADGQTVEAWSEDDVEGALEQAILAGLVRETGGESYVFNHALTQQALYAELSTRRRKRLHLAAGRALEHLPEKERERRAGELAWHFLEADDVVQALRYAMLAGDRSEQVFANSEAERHYRTAVELSRELVDTAKEAEALEKLAEILAIGAQYDQALEMLEAAAHLQHTAGDWQGEACIVARVGHVHYLRNTPAEGIARLKPLVESLEDSSKGVPTFGLAALWAALARLYARGGTSKEQLKAADRAIELALAVRNNPESSSILMGAEISRSIALWGLGRDEDALKGLESVIARAEAAGELAILSRALSSASMFYARRGEFDKDRQYLERMLQVSELRGDRGQIVLGAMSLSNHAFIVGDWKKARSYMERAERILQTLGTTHLSTWPTAARGWLALREGDLEGAWSYGEEALTLAKRTEQVAWQRFVARLLAERDLAAVRPESALERLEPYRSNPTCRDDGGFLRTLAEVHLELGNDSEAQELATQAISMVTREQDQPELVESLVVQGMIMTRQERWENADTLFTEALAVARRIPFPYGEARALYEHAMMEAQQGDVRRARNHFNRALTIFQRLGASRDVERAERTIANLAGPPRARKSGSS